MARICLLLLLCTGITFGLQAQPALQGVLTVLEAGTNQPVPGIQVRFNGNLAGTTDNQGTLLYEQRLLPATVMLTGAGFEPVQLRWDSRPQAGTITIARRQHTLNETVVTGTPRPTRLKNALSNYRIIDMEEAKAQGNINLADALSTQLNINVSNDLLLGSKVQMQGLNGSKIKVLIDGLPVNGRENGNIDMGQINLNNIARVEVVQGPMSVVYGSDALGGVINLITRRSSQPLTFNGSFNYESVGRYNADAAISRSWKRHQLSLGGGRNFFRGWNDLDTFTDRPHRRLLWKPKEQYLANGAYTYTTDSGFRLQLASDFVREKVTNRGAAAISPLEGYAFDEYYRTTRSSNRLILEGRLGKNGHWESRNSYAYYHRVKERTKKDLVTLDEVLTEQSGDQDTTTFNDVNLRSNYSNVLRKLKYDAGYDVNLQYAYSGKIPGGTRHTGDYAIYENAAYAFLKDRLTLQAGLRQTYNTQYRAPFIYSLHALYTPAAHVQLRASYAKGFRAPTLKEQYLEFIDQNHHILGNPDLRAEYSDALQLSASWQPYERQGNYLQLILTGYYNNVRDQISLAAVHPEDPTSIDYIYANASRVRNVIGNLQAEAQYKDLHLVLQYGYTHYLVLTGYQEYDVQEVVARANYFWRKPGLSLNAFCKLNGSAPNISYGADGNAAFNGTLPAYTMVDVSASKKCWHGRIELIAGIKNLFDVQQVTAAGSTGTGSAHATDNSGGSFLPRRLFTTLRLGLY